jgi:type I restriction enzyme R subunit
MVGRGTRLAENKLMFTIYDYTDATRLFGNKLISLPPGGGGGSGGGEDGIKIVQIEGIDVEVSDEGRFLVTEVDGNIKRVTVEEYKQRLADRLLNDISSFDDFRKKWVNPNVRRKMLEELIVGGYSPDTIRKVDKLNDFDLYDILISVAYGKKPLKKNERVLNFQYKQRDWLETLPQETKDVIIAIVNQFAICGTDCIESEKLFKVQDVVKAGGLSALNKGGDAKQLLDEAKLRLFAA